MIQRVEIMEQAADFLLKTALVTEVSKMLILTSRGAVVLSELERSARARSSSKSGVSSSFYGSGLFGGK